MVYLKSIKLKYDERQELFHSEEITNSGIIPRLASIKNFCEEITAASNHREGGIQIENTALSKGSLVVVHFFAKTGEKSESSALKTGNVPLKRTFFLQARMF